MQDQPKGASLGKSDPLPLPTAITAASLSSLTVMRVRNEFERKALLKRRESAVLSEHDPVEDSDMVEMIGKLLFGVPARKIAADLQLPEIIVEGVASMLPLKAIKDSAAAEVRRRMDEAVLYRASRLEEQVDKFKRVSERVAEESGKMLDSIPADDAAPSDKTLEIVSTAASATKAAFSILEKATGMDRKEAQALSVNVTAITSFEFPDDNPLAAAIPVEVAQQRSPPEVPESKLPPEVAPKDLPPEFPKPSREDS